MQRRLNFTNSKMCGNQIVYTYRSYLVLFFEAFFVIILVKDIIDMDRTCDESKAYDMQQRLNRTRVLQLNGMSLTVLVLHQ